MQPSLLTKDKGMVMGRGTYQPAKYKEKERERERDIIWPREGEREREIAI